MESLTFEYAGAFGLGGLFWLGIILTWWKTYRLYRGSLSTAIEASARALRANKTRSHEVRFFVVLFGVTAAVLIFITFSVRMPVGPPATLLFCFGTTTAMVVSSRLLPPQVLFLGSSTSRLTSHLAATLSDRFKGFRTISFRKPPATGTRAHMELMSSRTAGGQNAWAMFNRGNQWADNLGDWREVVFPLMDVVPLVVVDVRGASESLSEEISRIEADPDLLRKTLFFGSHSMMAPSEFADEVRMRLLEIERYGRS